MHQKKIGLVRIPKTKNRDPRKSRSDYSRVFIPFIHLVPPIPLAILHVHSPVILSQLEPGMLPIGSQLHIKQSMSPKSKRKYPTAHLSHIKPTRFSLHKHWLVFPSQTYVPFLSDDGLVPFASHLHFSHLVANPELELTPPKYPSLQFSHRKPSLNSLHKHLPVVCSQIFATSRTPLRLHSHLTHVSPDFQ